ncbi:hypothetical protein BDZ97DRAFT_1620698, partial [Flammula alnicola]
GSSKSDSATQPGRGIRKVVDLYHDLSDLLTKSDKHVALTCLDSEELEELDVIDFFGMTPEEIEEERKDRKRCHTAVQLLNTLIPGFQDKAAQADEADNLASYLAPLQAGANDARSDDTSKLKVVVADWLNKRIPAPNPPLAVLDRQNRGIGNDVTGRLLCPIDYDWDDPEVRANLRNMELGFDMASSFFFCCLYEKESGNPAAPEVGFLKGPLLVRVYRHIFTSPSSAHEENELAKTSSRRRDVASTLHLNHRVSPRSIAYAAVQLIFSLSNAKDWTHLHAGVHYPSFYNFVTNFFEGAQDPVSKRGVSLLLQWWNRCI